MKTQVVKTEIPGRYVLLLAADDGSTVSFNFQATESELRQLFTQLREYVGE